MRLTTQSQPFTSPRINGRRIKETTKVFDSKEEAETYARQKRSYVFNVCLVEEINGKEIESLYGFGVPL